MGSDTARRGARFRRLVVARRQFSQEVYQLLGSVLDTAQTIVTIAAMVVGGVWTYMLFVVRRQRHPRAELSHSVQTAEIAPGRRLVHVTVAVTNVGDVLVRLVSGCTRLQQVAPLSDDDLRSSIEAGRDPVPAGASEVEWPFLAERAYDWGGGPVEIEPGESETIHCDFVVTSDLRVAEVYTHLDNESKKRRKLGWCQTSLVELGALI